MCGIVGYVGRRPGKPIILDGLKRLEYRGYDSAGHRPASRTAASTTCAPSATSTRLIAGRRRERLRGHARARPHALGDARPAQRGERPPAHRLRRARSRSSSTASSRTTASCARALDRAGHTFTQRDRRRGRRPPDRARTTTGDLAAAVRAALRASSRATTPSSPSTADEPDLVVGTRRRVPARRRRRRGRDVLRLGDPAPSCRETRRVQSARGRRRRHAPRRRRGRTSTLAGDAASSARTIEVDWDDDAAEKGGYETFMLKEIYEQPAALRETIAGRLREDGTRRPLRGLGHWATSCCAACGASSSSPAAPSYHAGLVGRYAIEELGARAGRARHRQRVPLPQPGLRPGHARDRHLAVGRDAPTRSPPCGSRASAGAPRARDHEHDGQPDHARGRLRALHARRAWRSASRRPRRFTAQVAALLPARAASWRGCAATHAPRTSSSGSVASCARCPRRSPSSCSRRRRAPIEQIAERHYDEPFFLYLGRGIGFAVCLEGALKLKEISLHPDRGLLGRRDEARADRAARRRVARSSVVADRRARLRQGRLATSRRSRARGAHVIADRDRRQRGHRRAPRDDVIYVPKTDRASAAGARRASRCSCSPTTSPRLRGLNVDQPRNLAKTVTVE